MTVEVVRRISPPMGTCGEGSIQAVESHERCVKWKNPCVFCKKRANPFMLILRAVEASNLNIWRLHGDVI